MASKAMILSKVMVVSTAQISSKLEVATLLTARSTVWSPIGTPGVCVTNFVPEVGRLDSVRSLQHPGMVAQLAHQELLKATN